MGKIVWQKRRLSTRFEASALKLTLIVSLVITLLLGSLIYLYTFYKQQDEHMARRSKLLQIMESAMTLSQSVYLPHTDTLLYDQLYAADTLHLRKSIWGLYDKIDARVRYGVDSLHNAFMLGQLPTDSTVLYVADEDRNLSVSGKTRIVGTAFLPQAGITPAFVDGKYYEGKESIVEGKKKYSQQQMPPVNHARIEKIRTRTEAASAYEFGELPFDHGQSFFLPTLHVHHPLEIDLSGYRLSGNIILQSDTSIYIGNSSTLENLICIAPSIRIEQGFRGSIQIFATDSISIGEEVVLEYPSAVALDASDSTTPKKISIAKNSRIEGTVLLLEKERKDTHHLLEFGENCTIYGDLIAFGMLKYHKPMTVYGSTYCYRLITQTPSSLYENYLIDLDLDRLKRSPHYLQGYVWDTDVNKQINRILTWHD